MMGPGAAAAAHHATALMCHPDVGHELTQPDQQPACGPETVMLALVSFQAHISRISPPTNSSHIPHHTPQGSRAAAERAIKLCYGLSVLGSIPLVIMPFYNLLLPLLFSAFRKRAAARRAAGRSPTSSDGGGCGGAGGGGGGEGQEGSRWGNTPCY
jgi:hypothetical protein